MIEGTNLCILNKGLATDLCIFQSFPSAKKIPFPKSARATSNCILKELEILRRIMGGRHTDKFDWSNL
jgi:hypothetical protein